MSSAAKRLLVRAYLSGYEAAWEASPHIVPTSRDTLEAAVFIWWRREYPNERLDYTELTDITEEFLSGLQ